MCLPANITIEPFLAKLFCCRSASNRLEIGQKKKMKEGVEVPKDERKMEERKDKGKTKKAKERKYV